MTSWPLEYSNVTSAGPGKSGLWSPVVRDCSQTERQTSDAERSKGRSMNRVSGKVALISGGASGMGAAVARLLVADAGIANQWRDDDLHGS